MPNGLLFAGFTGTALSLTGLLRTGLAATDERVVASGAASGLAFAAAVVAADVCFFTVGRVT